MVVYCAVCGEELSRETVVLPATGHTRGMGKIENRTPATCEQDGSYEIVYDCKDCGKELRRALILLPAAGHTPAAEVRENEKPATRAANGSSDTAVYSPDCGEELSRETVTIPMTSHTGGTATCLEKAICEICGQPYGELAPHTPGTEYEPTKQIIGVPVRFAESK